jgi:hypothetical protein
MSLHTSLTQLHDALKTFRQVWSDISPQWTDHVRQEFVQEHWQPLEEMVVSVATHMERLNATITALTQELSRRETP